MPAQVITEAETALGYLEHLTEVLRSRGWAVEVSAPAGRRPTALVANPAMRALNENVIAAPERSGGAWAYFYGWGERITPCSDPEGAATMLGRVLSARRDA